MSDFVAADTLIAGDSREALQSIAPESIACSIWSPPYHVGKAYEVDMSYENWTSLLESVICQHPRVLKPGGFLAINIADILCFKDDHIPRIMAENVSRKRVKVTREQVMEAMIAYPTFNRQQIADVLGCSEQTVDRRLKGNNIRGGKYAAQTRVKLVGGLLEEIALRAGLYLYDRRIWMKDSAWENSRWHSNSYRAVDEFEYVYIFWKPGVTIIDRERLSKQEWVEWGSRGVWSIPSVRANNDHEAKFPLELPRRLIKLLTQPDDIVLDCFVESGTTAVAAVMEGRRYIGIDQNKHYIELAKAASSKASEQVRGQMF